MLFFFFKPKQSIQRHVEKFLKNVSGYQAGSYQEGFKSSISQHIRMELRMSHSQKTTTDRSLVYFFPYKRPLRPTKMNSSLYQVNNHRSCGTALFQSFQDFWIYNLNTRYNHNKNTSLNPEIFLKR